MHKLTGAPSLSGRWHGAGPPLILLPGLGGRGMSWSAFLRAAASRFRVLTFDPRGSGDAPPLIGETSIRDFAAETLALLDVLEIERCALLGRSMGGMVAQELALLAPRRIERLVLVSTTARCGPHLAEVFRLWARMAEQGVPAELRHQSSLLWCLGERALAREPRVRRYLAARSAGDRPADYALQARACAEHDALERLGGVRIPTLVVSGTDDRLTPPAHAETLAKAIPAARLRYIPGAGHLVHVEAPERFAAEVLGFLGAAEEA